MSSLQKFHRRTQSTKPVKALGSQAPITGAGFYLGMAGDGTSYMYVSPKSTEMSGNWGSEGIIRNIISPTDGLGNSNTLSAYGNTTANGHYAAWTCRQQTTGGYNTWYLPAKNELLTAISNQFATPFATVNAFTGDFYWSSTETDSASGYQANRAWSIYGTNANPGGGSYKGTTCRIRAVRRALV